MRSRLAIVPRMKASPIPLTIVAISDDAWCMQSGSARCGGPDNFSCRAGDGNPPGGEVVQCGQKTTPHTWIPDGSLVLCTNPRGGVHPARPAARGGAPAAAED